MVAVLQPSILLLDFVMPGNHALEVERSSLPLMIEMPICPKPSRRKFLVTCSKNRRRVN